MVSPSRTVYVSCIEFEPVVCAILVFPVLCAVFALSVLSEPVSPCCSCLADSLCLFPSAPAFACSDFLSLLPSIEPDTESDSVPVFVSSFNFSVSEVSDFSIVSASLFEFDTTVSDFFFSIFALSAIEFVFFNFSY